MWTCKKCGTKVDPSFDVCWECGTSIEGVEDPTFVKADDSGPIADAPVVDKPLADALQAEDALDEGAPNLPADELVECYWARSTYEAKFLADKLIDMGIPAAPDDVNLRYFLAGLPLGPYFGPRVWVRKQDHDKAHAWLEGYDREHKEHFDPGLGD